MVHKWHATLVAAAVAVSLSDAAIALAADESKSGNCFVSAPLPALRSGTKVFLLSELFQEGGTNAQGQRVRLELTGGSITVAKRADGLSAPVLVVGEEPIKLRATKRICIYGPDVPVPAALSGVQPDIVIP